MRKKRVVFVLVILVFLLFLFKGEIIFLTPLKSIGKFFYSISADLTNKIWPAFSSGVGSAFGGECQEIKKENFGLKEEVNKLLAEQTDLEVLQNENDVLREYLNFSQKISYQILLANVLSQRIELGTNWFLLDQGEKQGIKKGMAVVNQQGLLIGRIAKVLENFSYLLPSFDPHFSLAVDIIDLKRGVRTSGIFKDGEVNYLPQSQEIEEGDKVVTAGLEENVAPDLLFGKVAKVKKDPHQVFIQALVEVLANRRNLKIVGIVLKK